MLGRTKMFVFIEKNTFFKMIDNLDNDKVKIKNVTIVQDDGVSVELEPKDLFKMFDLSGDDSVSDYIKDHPDELADMLNGTHGAINLSAVGIWSTGKVAFFFDNLLTTGNRIWLDANVLPSLTLEGKGNLISVISRYDISIKREEDSDGWRIQSVEMREYFGDKISTVCSTGWFGEQTVLFVTQYDCI